MCLFFKKENVRLPHRNTYISHVASYVVVKMKVPDCLVVPCSPGYVSVEHDWERTHCIVTHVRAYHLYTWFMIFNKNTSHIPTHGSWYLITVYHIYPCMIFNNYVSALWIYPTSLPFCILEYVSSYKNNIYYKAMGCVMQTPASDAYRYPVSRLHTRALNGHMFSTRLGWIHAVVLTHCHVSKGCSNAAFSVVSPPWRLKQHTCAPEDYHSEGGCF